MVLAGVNGAGKSSVGGAALRQIEMEWFNPDTFSRELRQRTGIDRAEADSSSWQEGKRRLEEAITTGASFAFETTLGGSTITNLLKTACTTHDVIIWYCGLASVELHIERVRNRVAVGGHSIPEERIRERWNASRLNLIELISHVHEVYVYDNSASVEHGHAMPDPILVAHIVRGRLIEPAPDNAVALERTPEWAKPIVRMALQN
jgi:predicted ABC-type ATPase